MYLDILTVNNYNDYVGREAIYNDSINGAMLVKIVAATKMSATIRHPNGALQKALWNNLLVSNYTE